jgi:hypothetical protein
MELTKLNIEEIYNKIYQIALSTDDKNVELHAWSLLLTYKKDLEFKESRDLAMQSMISSLSKF